MMIHRPHDPFGATLWAGAAVLVASVALVAPAVAQT